MGGRKITVTVSEAQYKALCALAEREGLGRVSTLVKSVALKKANAPRDGDTKEVVVTLDNFGEIEEYARIKRFGSVGSFAGYAMEAWMQRNPLTAVQKALAGKSINQRQTDAL